MIAPTRARAARVPPRLAFAVVHYFPHGGLQRALVRIGRGCRRRGADVHLYVARIEGTPPEDFVVHHLPVAALTNHGLNARFAESLRQALGQTSVDCVVGFTKMAGLDIYYAGDPCYAARPRPALYRFTPRYRALVQQEAAVFAAGGDTEILLVAHNEQARYSRHYGTEPHRFHRLAPGLEPARLRLGGDEAGARLRMCKELGLKPQALIMLQVASRFRTKGVDRTIRALAALPAALRRRSELVVVGADRCARLRALAVRLGVGGQVHFVGGRDDIVRFYAAADLFVHPARTENTGNVLLEAMYCGLPVLAAAECGFAQHVLRAQAGLVCPAPFRQRDFNACLVRMLRADDRPRWAQNGRRYCGRMDGDALALRAAEVILDRAARNRSAHRRPGGG